MIRINQATQCTIKAAIGSKILSSSATNPSILNNFNVPSNYISLTNNISSCSTGCGYVNLTRKQPYHDGSSGKSSSFGGSGTGTAREGETRKKLTLADLLKKTKANSENRTSGNNYNSNYTNNSHTNSSSNDNSSRSRFGHASRFDQPGFGFGQDSLFSEFASPPPSSSPSIQRGGERRDERVNGQRSRNGKNFRRRPRDEVPNFDFSGGSFQAQDCIKHLVRKVYKELNKEGQITFVDPETNSVESTTLEQLLKEKIDLDLDAEGLMIVNVVEAESKRNGDPIKIPMIKLVDKRTALQKYSDELSEIKSQEIAAVSNKFANILQRKKLSKVQDTKYIKIGWSISDADLKSKKRNEIILTMEKVPSFLIFIDAKDQLRKVDAAATEEGFNAAANAASDNSSPFTKKYRDLNELELVKREKTLAAVLQILEESGIKHVCHHAGSVEGRYILKISVNKQSLSKKTVNATSNGGSGNDALAITMENLDNVEDILEIDLSQITDKKLLKEIRKRQRQEKQRLREEKKKSKKESEHAGEGLLSLEM